MNEKEAIAQALKVNGVGHMITPTGITVKISDTSTATCIFMVNGKSSIYVIAYFGPSDSASVTIKENPTLDEAVSILSLIAM